MHITRYGVFEKNKWLPVITHVTKSNECIISKKDSYEIMILDLKDIENIDFPYLLRNKARKNQITTFDHIDSNVNIGGQHYVFNHVLLASIFPEVLPEKHVDHIDNNAQNLYIENLQWLSLPENCRKGQAKSVLTPRHGMFIIMTHPNFIKVETFISICAAARYIKELLQITTKLTTIEAKIRYCIYGYEIIWVSILQHK